MTTALFRQAALDARRDTGTGEPLLPSPLGATAFAVAAVLIAAAAMVFVGTVEVPRRVTVRGYLAPDQGVVRLRAPTGGVMVAVAIEQGDAVVAGQELGRIESRRSTGDATDVSAAAMQDFAALRAELLAQRAVAEAALDAELAENARRATALEREITGLATLRAAADARQVQATQRQREIAPAVASGVLPVAQLHQQRDKADELRLEALRIAQQVMQRADDRAGLEAERSAIERRSRLRLAELDAALARLAIDQRDAALQHEAVVRAPIAGTVLRVAARTGAVVHPGQPVVTLAPAGAPLRAVLLVPARDAGMLAERQSVVLRLDAFPHQRFGVQRARLTRIGASVILPGETEQPIAANEPVFEVHAELEATQVEAYGRRWPLRTDLTLEADVVLERATLFERLLDPLRAVTRRYG